MKDSSLFKHRFFNTPNKRISVLSIILIALSVIIVASLIGENQDISGEAKVRESASLAAGCYYRLPCPARHFGNKPQFDCQPVLVCPKPPSPKLTCQQCIANKQQQLCFDPMAKVSYCLDSDTVTDGISCVSCSDTKPTPSCIPRPSCVDNPPYCLLPVPTGGWCKPNPTGRACLDVLTPARNETTRVCQTFSNSCLPVGWVVDKSCATSPTSTACPTPPVCLGTATLQKGEPDPNDVNRCPVYRCINTSPTSGSTVLPQ